MGMFVISKRLNGDYKFIFATRKGKTIFTSIGFRHKTDCEQMLAAIKENMDLFTFTKYKKAGDKYFFRITKEGLVLANSRKYSTELMLLKGINEVMGQVNGAEILDFSENSFVFPEEDFPVGNLDKQQV